MVDDAIHEITSLLAARNLHLAQAKPIRDSGKEDSVFALRKYFNLPMDRTFFDRVPFVLDVYRRICRGLAGGYEIKLYREQTSEHGYVPANPKAFEGALLRYMNTQPDANGHVPWPSVPTGQIHLNLGWVDENKTTSEVLARTIVHEASHRWAYTTDVCYKSASIAKIAAELDRKNGTTMAKELIDMGLQPSHAIPGRAKALLPMTSWKHFEENKTLSAQDWLQNADSYAWAARRFWKRAGRKGL